MLKKGPIQILGSYIVWGLLPVFWRQLEAIDSLYVLGMRVVWATLLVALILLFRQERFAGVRAVLRDRQERNQLMLSGCCVCINWGIYIWAVGHGHMIDASLAYYMSPIFSILIGTILFREKLTRFQWLAVAVVFTGIVITVIRYRQIPWIALVIASSFAAYGGLKKTVRADSVVSTFVETLALAPVFLVLVVWMECRGNGAAGVLTGWQWLLLPLAGVVTVIPLVLFSAGIKGTSVVLAGILMYVNPTLQLLVSVLLYREEFTATHAILFGFVWGGLALYMLADSLKRKGKKKACA